MSYYSAPGSVGWKCKMRKGGGLPVFYDPNWTPEKGWVPYFASYTPAPYEYEGCDMIVMHVYHTVPHVGSLAYVSVTGAGDKFRILVPMTQLESA
jgi:hypothetical protein